jgi:hypothetical protein
MIALRRGIDVVGRESDENDAYQIYALRIQPAV